METDAPFRIVTVSRGWERLCGFDASQMRGQTLSVLQGPLTNRAAVRRLVDAAHRHEPTSARLVNYSRTRLPFEHEVFVDLLRDPSGAPRYLQATSLVLQPPGEGMRPSDGADGAQQPRVGSAAHLMMLSSRELIATMGV